MNYYYATLHFIVTIGVLVWLYRCHPGPLRGHPAGPLRHHRRGPGRLLPLPAGAAPADERRRLHRHRAGPPHLGLDGLRQPQAHVEPVRRDAVDAHRLVAVVRPDHLRARHGPLGEDPRPALPDGRRWSSSSPPPTTSGWTRWAACSAWPSASRLACVWYGALPHRLPRWSAAHARPARRAGCSPGARQPAGVRSASVGVRTGSGGGCRRAPAGLSSAVCLRTPAPTHRQTPPGGDAGRGLTHGVPRRPPAPGTDPRAARAPGATGRAASAGGKPNAAGQPARSRPVEQLLHHRPGPAGDAAVVVEHVADVPRLVAQVAAHRGQFAAVRREGVARRGRGPASRRCAPASPAPRPRPGSARPPSAISPAAWAAASASRVRVVRRPGFAQPCRIWSSWTVHSTSLSPPRPELGVQRRVGAARQPLGLHTGLEPADLADRVLAEPLRGVAQRVDQLDEARGPAPRRPATGSARSSAWLSHTSDQRR